MAVGGALRAAIRAGRFGAAARESRQQARAVRSLNESGFGQYVASGGGGRLPMSERGFSYRPGQFYGEGMGGQVVTAPPMGGGRASVPMGFNQYEAPLGFPMRQPIEAPYEGFRVWPGGRMNQLPGFGETMNVGAMPGATTRSMYPGTPFTLNAPPPWLGRGNGPVPSTGRFFDRDMSYGGGRMYDWEMGPLQGQQFFAPSTPIPGGPSGYYNTDIFEELYRAGYM